LLYKLYKLNKLYNYINFHKIADIYHKKWIIIYTSLEISALHNSIEDPKEKNNY